MSEEKKKNIASALDKMEAQSAVLAQENRKARIVDKHSHRKEVEQEKVIRVERKTEQKELKEFEFRSQTTQLVLGLVISIIVVWNLSLNQRTSLIENAIIIILFCGIVAAKKSR